MKLSWTKLVTIGATISFISVTASATPKIIFKDFHHKKGWMKSFVVPQSTETAIKTAIKTIEAKNPDLYQVVVYPLKDHYLLYLSSSKTWAVTKARVDLDLTNKTQKITYPYPGNANELPSATEDQPICPDPSVQFVAISAYPGIAAVDESIAKVAMAASKKYKTIAILNELADGQTYKNWLSCPSLKGFYSIGHGSPEGIMVGNGDFIGDKYFEAPTLTNKFKSTTIIINSCLVYNYPFGTQMMFGNALDAKGYAENPGPNTFEYLGGHTSLLMYSSERTSACFIIKAMDGAPMDYNTLQQCVGAKDLNYRSFGLSNPGRYFDR